MATEPPGPPLLGIQPTEYGAEVSKDYGTLQATEDLAAEWANGPGVESPHAVEVTAPRRFFRVRTK